MKHYPVENVYLHTSRHLPLVPNQKSCALCYKCLVHSTSLVSNNHPGSNYCSVENNFHFNSECLVFSSSSVRPLSVWNIIQLRMSIFSVNVILPFAPSQKSCALCDDCLVYSTSLVFNNYLGSNKCSVENYFHLLVNVLFQIALLLTLMSVWNIIQLIKSMLTLHVIFYLIPIQKSSSFSDNCLVYSTSLVWTTI